MGLTRRCSAGQFLGGHARSLIVILANLIRNQNAMHIMHRLEKLWVSKLLDKHEGAWQPGGKSDINPLLNKGDAKESTKGKNTDGVRPSTTKVASRKGSKVVRERWEQAPKKGAVGNVGADLKKLEVKMKKTGSVIAKEVQSEVKAIVESKTDGGSEDAEEDQDIIQLDGNADLDGSSDDDEELDLADDSDDDDSDGSDESSEDEGEAGLGDALGSDDDISDEDASEFLNRARHDFVYFIFVSSFGSCRKSPLHCRQYLQCLK